jgi:ceramide glucosyltransferase
LTWLRWALLGAAVLPSLSYLLVIFSARRFFRRQRRAPRDFTPPLSVLKPAYGLEPEAYENFASFCRQDYPQYEVLFGVSSEQDAAIPVIRKLIADFPAIPIRLLIATEKIGANDKVNKLCALAHGAQHDFLVLSDADIRVAPGHLRTVAAPFRDARVGVVTSLYTGIPVRSFWPELEAIYLSTDFMSAVLMARQVEGIRFALGATVAIRRSCLAEIGGFEGLADDAADDYELGRRTAARGHRVELVDASVKTWCCLQTPRDFLLQRLRWAIMARQARPLGYLGYAFTHGLPWTLLAMALAPTRLLAASFVAAYLIFRGAAVWTVGVWGLRHDLLKRRWFLVPLWDAFAFLLWLVSLFWNRVRWRGAEYRVVGHRLVPVAPRPPR